MESIYEEYKKWSPFKERSFINPFSTLKEIWLFLLNENFRLKIANDKKFFMFIRKKLFWVLGDNVEEHYLLFKDMDSSETDERVVAIADQILLIYFEENLTFFDLCKISLRNDEYNSITAYSINSKRGDKINPSLN